MQERKEQVISWGFDATRIEFCDHHRAHAARAYFGLRKDDQPYLVLTLDGGGDGLSGSVWIAANGELESVAKVPQADRLGEIYAVTTHYLVFMPLEHGLCRIVGAYGGLQQRIAGQPVCSVEPGAGYFPRGIETRQGAPAPYIRLHSPAKVVGRRDDRNAISSHVDPVFHAFRVNVRKSLL